VVRREPLAHRPVALLIATDTYEDPSFPPLQAPVSDAERLAEVLADPAIGEFDVRPVLINQPVSALTDRIEEFLGERRHSDLALIYFACHGVRDDAGRFHFVSSNTRRERLGATGLSARWVHERVDDSRARQKLVILDCCNSGAFSPELATRAADVKAGQEVLRGRGSVILTASNALQFAYERGTGALKGEPPAGLFTSALISGLRTGLADRDGDGWVSVHNLYEYVVDKLHEENVDQSPSIWSDLSGDLRVARNPYHLPQLVDQWESRTVAGELRDAVQIPGDATGLIAALREVLEAISGIVKDSGLWPAAFLELVDACRRLPGGAEAVASGLELFESVLRLNKDHSLANAAHELAEIVGRLLKDDTLTRSIHELEVALAKLAETVNDLLVQDEVCAAGQVVGEHAARKVRECADAMRKLGDNPEIESRARRLAIELRGLARSLRAFVGDRDLYDTIGELLSVARGVRANRLAVAAMTRLTGVVYVLAGDVLTMTSDEIVEGLRTAGDDVAAIAIGDDLAEGIKELLDELISAVAEGREVASNLDTLSKVRTSAGALRNEPDSLAMFLGGLVEGLLKMRSGPPPGDTPAVAETPALPASGPSSEAGPA
jgi:Caspase domain